MWSTLTQLNPNTYFHHSRRPIHELHWIEEIKEPRANRLRLNESLTNDIYISKVKANNEKIISFFTYCFLKIRYLVPELSEKEKLTLIEEAFEYISEIEIMSNINKLEEKIKKNVYRESFFVHYYLIKNGITDLYYVFSSLDEFPDSAFKEFIEKTKEAKINYYMKNFLKNRIKKSELIIKASNESRNLVFMNIKNLISEYESTEDDVNVKLIELTKITKDLFNDGKTILDNFHERKKFIAILYDTVDECLHEGLSI